MCYTEDDIVGVVGPPLLPPVQLSPQNKQRDTVADDEDAFSLRLLLDEFGDRWQFSWIKERIQLMWPEINVAARRVTNTSCNQRMPHRLRVCTAVFTDSLSFTSGGSTAG